MTIIVKAKGESVESKMTIFQQIGLGVAMLFYLCAIVWVFFLSPSSTTFAPGVKVLTLGHWQLEDGFREGMAEAITRFEELKRQQGQEVRINQTPIPWRGYTQWMLTQLVGGRPADIIEVTGDPNLRYLYFRPLSPYLGKPNPFNAGTPLEGIAWKDTYIDGMLGTFDATYAEWYRVPLAFLPIRLHVNLDLVKEATGSEAMPTDLQEWMEICQKVKEHGERIQKPIGAIGVRGTDKGTLARLYIQYYSETNGNLIDEKSRFCDGTVSSADILQGLLAGTVEVDQQTAAAEITTELGQYFITGFPSMDLEQAKYLFTRGMIAFLPEGTWESLSLVQNAAKAGYRVGIVRVPPIGTRGKYAKYWTGKTTESGIQTGVSFGIPKACKEFDLALEFIQFMSSYEIDQMMMEKCRWGPGVKFAKYTGLQAALKPDVEGNPAFGETPFSVGVGTGSYGAMLKSLESLIQNNPADPGKVFLEEFRGRKKIAISDQMEMITGGERANVGREMQRSQLSIGLLRKDASSQERERLELRRRLATESLPEMAGGYFMGRLLLESLQKL